MSDKVKRLPLFVGGLSGAGKTTFCCAMLRLAQEYGLKAGGFKPFDVGLLERNAKEQFHDGQLFCQNMPDDPNENLVSPYLAHERYPIEMAFRRDGIRIDWKLVQQRLQIFNQTYDRTFLELPGGLHEPLAKDIILIDWMKQVGRQAVWIIQPKLSLFEHNLMELKLLKEEGFKLHIVINNLAKTIDPDLLFYMWQKIEDVLDQQLEGMIPFIPSWKSGKRLMIVAMEENLPNLIRSVFPPPLEKIR